MSFDVDHSTSGTVFEYNISHDNEGGFLLLCPYEKPTRNFTVRYNLSVNDRARIIQVCDGGLEDGRIYKNTFYIGDGLSPNIVDEATDENIDVLFVNNIIRKGGTGTAHWLLNNTEFNVTNNAFHGAIDTHADATNVITGEPGLAAPGLRDPKAYLLLSGFSAFDSAMEIPGDAEQDFFSNPTTGHANLGFYSGEGAEKPAWISNFDGSALSEWSVQGLVDVVADPAGDRGKSARVKPHGRISRQLTVEVPFRLNARVWIDSSASQEFPSVQVGKAKTSFSSSVNYLVGEWQILEIMVTSDSAEATLDGELFAAVLEGESSDVVFASGEITVYVDDVFVTPL